MVWHFEAGQRGCWFGPSHFFRREWSKNSGANLIGLNVQGPGRGPAGLCGLARRTLASTRLMAGEGESRPRKGLDGSMPTGAFPSTIRRFILGGGDHSFGGFAPRPAWRPVITASRPLACPEAMGSRGSKRRQSRMANGIVNRSRKQKSASSRPRPPRVILPKSFPRWLAHPIPSGLRSPVAHLELTGHKLLPSPSGSGVIPPAHFRSRTAIFVLPNCCWSVAPMNRAGEHIFCRPAVAARTYITCRLLLGSREPRAPSSCQGNEGVLRKG